jgi:prevent-host-death family protein
MRAIGIRALRQQASQYLRDVQRGETIEVTDRGHPIARLVPVPRNQGVEALAASGRVTLAQGDALDLGLPLAPAKGAVLPGEAMAEAREDER